MVRRYFPKSRRRRDVVLFSFGQPAAKPRPFVAKRRVGLRQRQELVERAPIGDFRLDVPSLGARKKGAGGAKQGVRGKGRLPNLGGNSEIALRGTRGVSFFEHGRRGGELRPGGCFWATRGSIESSGPIEHRDRVVPFLAFAAQGGDAGEQLWVVADDVRAPELGE